MQNGHDKATVHAKTTSSKATKKKKGAGLTVPRVFSTKDSDPLKDVIYERRSCLITNPDGSVVFKMDGAMVPAGWSQLATDIVISKYFRRAGLHGNPESGETSVEQVVRRIAHTIRVAGAEAGYFATSADAYAFEAELSYVLVHQYGAFNSPVWFNLGLWHEYEIKGQGGNWAWDDEQERVVETEWAYERPQCSACFIQAVHDDLMSIYDLLKSEARLFKYGSGTGSNFSAIRGRQEKLSGGGSSSGLMSFLEVFDRAAGSTKSGGTTRRAAKMVCLDADHPEIEDFIHWKVREEKKAQTLIAGGYPSDFNGEAYHTVSGQNSNNSIRVTDTFLHKATGHLPDSAWPTRLRTTGEVCEMLDAKKLWGEIADAAWGCADPGLQYDTTINRWHTCPNSGRINASNPCCITGDMLVDTSEGLIPFEKLEEMAREGKDLPYVFAFDKVTGLPVLRAIKKVWVAGETHDLVEVRTQRGLTLRATLEHGFLLRSGAYVPAGSLEPGMRLRKIGRWVNEQRSSRRYINHRATPAARNGTVEQSRFMWEQANGPIPDGCHVHHKNEDPTDDRLSNFELRDGIEHIREHSSGEDNPRFLDVDANVLVDVWEEIEAKIQKDMRRQAASFSMLTQLRDQGLSYAAVANALDDMGFAPERGDSWSASSVAVALKQGHVGRQEQSVTVARWNMYVHQYGLEGVVPLANPQRGIQGKTWEEFTAYIEQVRDEVNDRVLSVTPIKLGEDKAVKVYDMEVAGTHNFALTSPGAPSVHSIVVSNSEYMFLDDTACNLASVNLSKFLLADGTIHIEKYKHVCRVLFIAQEILVDLSSYPTKPIAKNSHDFRPLGLGYANLGSLLMSMGLPYDSDEGRQVAAALTAIMCGTAYLTSAQMAATLGPFAGYEKNAEPMKRVMGMHQEAARRLDDTLCPAPLRTAARAVWDEAVGVGNIHGYRNAQATVLAPTGTIGLLMDCDTTGVEPDFALVKFKKLAGGGHFKIVNQTVRDALKRLGYESRKVDQIVEYVSGTGRLNVVDKATLASKGLTHAELSKVENAIPGVFDLDSAFAPWILGEAVYDRLGVSKELRQKKGFSLLEFLGFTREQIVRASEESIGRMTIEGAPHLRESDYAIFDCANRCGKTGKRFLAPMAHVHMMAAVQPFLSGAISKTVNLPNEATVDDVRKIYEEGWALGLKAVALYRDGCKASQPLQASGEKKEADKADKAAAAEPLLTPMAAAPTSAGSPQLSLDIAPGTRLYGQRERLPKKRRGYTQEARVGGHKIFLRTGEYDDGRLGEIFIDMHKEGAAFRSLMNCFAMSVSVGLQYGVPLQTYVDQYTFTRFEPQGAVEGHSNVRFATSIIDYIFRVLGVEYLQRFDLAHVPPEGKTAPTETSPALPPGATLPLLGPPSLDEGIGGGGKVRAPGSALDAQLDGMMGDAPVCDHCGHITVRNGACYKCLNCGNSMGCS